MDVKPILFVFPDCDNLALPATGQFMAARFANHEITLQLQTDVKGRECSVVGNIAPPDENLFNLLTLAHTLKKEGASKVTAAIPYLAYARQDKNEPGRSWGLKLIGQLLQASGIDEVISIDVHSPSAAEILPLPITSLSPARVWGQMVDELNQDFTTIAAPDEGAVSRCQDVAREAGIKSDIAYITKQRVDGVEHTAVKGQVLPNAVIIDDVLDTGATLISAAQQLKSAGAKTITAAVSHGLFTGNDWQGIWQAGIQKLYCLDTTPQAKAENHPNIKVVPAKSIIVPVI